jgi:hypothetical protein
LFVLGVAGMLAVLPYNPPSAVEPLVVTSPADRPEMYPTPDLHAWSIENDEPSMAEEQQVAEEPASEPELEADPQPSVRAAGERQSRMQELAPLPDSTPSAEPSETPTPTVESATVSGDMGTPNEGPGLSGLEDPTPTSTPEPDDEEDDDDPPE